MYYGTTSSYFPGVLGFILLLQLNAFCPLILFVRILMFRKLLLYSHRLYIDHTVGLEQ
jgi:hypothetical protein